MKLPIFLLTCTMSQIAATAFWLELYAAGLAPGPIVCIRAWTAQYKASRLIAAPRQAAMMLRDIVCKNLPAA